MTFLRTILPGDGETCLAYIHPTRKTPDGRDLFVHRWVDLHNAELVQEVCEKWEREGLDTYYAMASFDDRFRRKVNAYRIRCVWMDLDAGPEKYKKRPEKTYPNAADAEDALWDWVDNDKIPEPTYLVASGFGLHVYWAFDEELETEEWYRIARTMVGRAADWGVRVDTGPSVNAIGVLRVPGTMHTRSGRRVEILESGPVHPVDDFIDAIGPLAESREPVRIEGLEAAIPEHLKSRAHDTAWDDQYGRDFGEILRRSEAHEPDSPKTGCEQLWIIATDQDSVEEPLWRAGLSIAQNCDDPEKWAHEISSQHSGYSASETDNKRLALTDKPYTCRAFSDLNRRVCTACPHFGKITSPIQLGKYVKTADDYEDLKERRAPEPAKAAPAKKTDVAMRTAQPVEEEAQAPGEIQLEDLEFLNTDKLLTFNDTDPLNWKPPFPFARKRGGGLVVRAGDGEDFEDTVFYEHDLICTDRMYDPVEDGEVLVFELYLPNDAVREIKMPLRIMASDDQMLSTLMRHGYMEPSKAKRGTMTSFLRACAKGMVADVAANETAAAMGWTADGSKFILGGRAYDKKHVRRAATQEDLQPLVHTTTMPPGADLQTWGDLADMYNEPGMEPAQFLMAASLGGPLYSLLGTNGSIIHVYSKDSGSGKTSAVRGALSIWGRPVRKGMAMGLENYAKDTENSLRTRLSQQNSIPMSVDEVTDFTDDRLRNLIYEFTQGTEKQRATGTGKLVGRVGTWDTCMFTTGNRSLFDRLGQASSREALFARFLEIDFADNQSLRTVLKPGDIERNLRALCGDHFGIVGHAFARYMTTNLEEVEDILYETGEQLDKVMRFTQAERYWRATLTCTLTAARIGIMLGAWDFDLYNLTEYMCNLVRKSRGDVAVNHEKTSDILSAYVLDNQDKMLEADETGRVLTSTLPRQKIAMRIDRQTGLASFVVKDVNAWASKAGYNTREMEKYFEQLGATRDRVYLLKGSNQANLNARPTCWVLPMSAIGGADPKEPTGD